MTMIKPNINMNEFTLDYDSGMSAYNLQRKYKLSSRQYRIIQRAMPTRRNYKKKKTGKKRKPKHYEFNEPYITERYGKYLVRRNQVYYGQYDTFKQAKYIKTRLIEEKWDKNQLDTIRDEINIEPLRSYQYDK